MSLFIASLNSGSNGNCYYIGNREEAILVDGGISCREIERRLKRLELSIKRVKAIFITHEHTDHIYGVSRLSKKYQLPVYITQGTLVNSRLNLRQDLVLSFTPYNPVKIGNIYVTALPIHHDASDPHSFVITCNAIKIGVFTDIGQTCEQVTYNFAQCHAAFLESNYDEVMLHTGRYPLSLKERIRGGKGHLSNNQAVQLFLKHRPAFMSHLFLSHLSAENNSPRLVHDLFKKVAGKTEIIVASRHEETPVYHISNTGQIKNARRSLAKHSQFQLSLFQ